MLSKDKKIIDLRFVFEGNQFEELIDRMWNEYVSSDSFCEQDAVKRKEQVYQYQSIKEIFDD